MRKFQFISNFDNDYQNIEKQSALDQFLQVSEENFKFLTMALSAAGYQGSDT